MKLSIREMTLSWATIVIVVLGGTFWLGQSRVQEWKEAIKARDMLNMRKKVAQQLLASEGSINERLSALRKQLPQHPADKDVTAELLMMLERTAKENGLIFTRRSPQKEKSAGDLYEVAIDCTWQGTLDAVVHFLYALQVQGAILDIRQLTISPGDGGAGSLKGTFTVDCAYSRASAGLSSVQSQPVKP